jgi:DNA-binding protein H-NS
MPKSYERLMNDIRKLQKQASKLSKRRDKAISTVKKLIGAHNLTAVDLGLEGTKRLAKRVVRKAKRVAPKYRGPGGVTWSGRGLMPRWLRDAVKDGKKREEFLIKKLASK